MNARYRFLPWVRLGASATAPDPLGPDLPARATLPLTLRVNQRHDVAVTARLHGPGDVVSIDTRQVVRTDPPHLASEFEPNYFPLVEFDRPDLPWLFTPATGTRAGKLRPWMVLVVVRRQPGVSITIAAASRRPVLRIAEPARPAAELPNLDDSWAWAHAQVLDAGTDTPLADQLAAASTHNLSRLLCPRRLAADTAYVACVVPAFEVGRLAGLGLTPTTADEERLVAAWLSGDDAPRDIDLPVLYHWEFSTGAAGDFETLARRLTPRQAPAASPGRPLSVGGLSFGIPDLGIVPLGGVLRPVGATPRGPLPSTFATALRTVLDLPARRLDGTSTDPVVGPPIYGSRQAAHSTIDRAPPWMATLNVDPRLRAVAGLGVAVVLEQQEHLMAAAWEQLGSAASAIREMRQPAFAGAVLRRVHRRLTALDADRLATVAAPAMSRVLVAAPGQVLRPAPTVTVRRLLAETRTPSTVLSAAFRRAVRPRGPLMRRAATATGGVPTRAPTKFITQLAAAAPGVFVRAPRPDMVTTQVIGQQLDRLAVPTQPIRKAQHDSLRKAVTAFRAYEDRLTGLRRPSDARPPFTASGMQPQVLDALDPARTVVASVPAVSKSALGTTAASSQPEGVGGPVFPQPMFETLRDLDPQFLFPGCDGVEPESVVPLVTDPAVIEAFMVGLNHEISRELLWREYPSDERGTPFQNFWPRTDRPSREDAPGQMLPIHTWAPASQLGSHLGSIAGAGLVILVRGELFSRYPGTVVYVTRSTTPAAPGSERVLPAFRGHLTVDVAFFGFAVTATQLASATWYVVFEQQPTEPRFGLDSSVDTRRRVDEIESWDGLSWGDLATSGDELAAMTHVPIEGRLSGRRIDSIGWGANGGHMAAITLQRSFRIARPLNELVP